MSDSRASTVQGKATFTRRGGLISAAVGVALTVVVSALLMRNALTQATQERHRNLGSLLVSSCQAGVALDDDEIVVESIFELAPQLGDLLGVTVSNAKGRVITRWRRGHRQDLSSSVVETLTITGLRGQAIGSLSLRLSTRRTQNALEKLWLSLGTVGALSLAVAALASHLLARELDEKKRLEGEFKLAKRIQTSLLPKELRLTGAEIAARMVPASEVGGDYYDVIPALDGGWICVGDVVGHGLPAGLMMLMMQSGLATALVGNNSSNPAEVLSLLNRAIFENAQRMGSDKYATLVIARYTSNGALHFAGGHLDLILVSARRNTTVLFPRRVLSWPWKRSWKLRQLRRRGFN